MKQERKKKRNAKKQIAMLLVCCMLFTLLPTTALASEPSTTVAKDITLGTSAIQEPTEVKNNSGIYHTPSSYIYFGKNDATPIKWRVLDADKANDGKTDGMFLLSEYELGKDVIFNKNVHSGNANQYQGNNAQTWCKNFAEDSENFSSSEQNAMFGVAKIDYEKRLYSLSWGESELTTADKLFFLSAEELANYVGNYDRAPGLAATDVAHASARWWLRSPWACADGIDVAIVDNDGGVYASEVGHPYATRPALNLNLSSVLFTSAADGKKTNNVGKLLSNTDYSGNEYKLTMKDTSRSNFSIDETAIKSDKGRKITIHYSGAETGDNEYISAMIVNGAKEVLYYGQIADEITTNSMINFSIPSDIEYGSYELCLFNEQINGDKETDYASDFQTVTLNVLPQATLETDPKANVLTYDGTEQELVTPGVSSKGTVKYSLSKDGTYTTTIPAGKDVGSYNVWYYIEGDTNYSDSDKANIEVTIAKSGSETQVITDSIITYGERLSLTATVGMSKMRAKATTDTVYFYIDESETLLGTAKVTYNNANKDSGTATLEVDTTDKQLTIGENTIIADYGGSISLNGSESDSITVTLKQKEVGLTWSGYENLVYDGKAKCVTASAIGFVAGDDVSIEVTGGDKMDAGTYTATAALTGTDAKYYQLPTNHTKDYTITKVSSGSAVATYTVKFDTNGGSAIKNQTVTEYQKAKEPTAPTKDGYTFAGWYTDKELTKAYDFSAKVTKNMTLYAKWIANSIDIWQNPFTDVHESDWFYNAVKYAHQNKLFAGMSATEFAPNMPMSRGMLVTVLYRLAGSPAVAGAMPFADVNSDAYYRNAILWAVQSDIVSGIGDNLFAPDANITREQLAVILHRYAQYKDYDTTQGGMQIREYNDYDNISGYALNAMTWAVNSGLLKGKGENTIAPQDSATRAEVAAILQRFIEGNK